jgi:hypothetical protein
MTLRLACAMIVLLPLAVLAQKAPPAQPCQSLERCT